MFANAQALIGQTIADYHLLRILGQGGMGAVFLAQHLDEPQFQVAIKVLLPSKYSLSETRTAFQARFMREARAMSLLQHQHIVPVLSYGKLEDLAYIVMPYLPGGTLSSRLRSEPIPLQEVNRYLHQLASALDYAHQQGIVHRDMKPANVLLDAEGDVALTDFGIARFFEGDSDLLSTVPVSLTVTGEVFGTPSYMAPEIFRGEAAKPAADIYALGVMFYQLVTGQLPFRGKGPLDVGIKHLNDLPLPPRSLRPELPEPAEAVLLQVLAKSPAERFSSAGAFAEAFAMGLKGHWASHSLQLAAPVTRILSAEQALQASESVVPQKVSALVRPPRNVKMIFAGFVVAMVMLQALVAGIVLGARNLAPSSTLSVLNTNAHKVAARAPVITSTPRAATATSIPVPSPTSSSDSSAYITVYNDPGAILITISNNRVYALSKNQGTILWSYTTNGVIVPQPVVTGSEVYIVTEKGQVYALSITNGAVAWSYNLHVHVSSPITVQNGLVIVYADNGNVYRLQASSGRLLPALDPTATPSPTPGTTPTPSATPVPPITPTPEITPTPTAISTPATMPTPIVPPDSTPEIMPTPSDMPAQSISIGVGASPAPESSN